MFLHHHIISAAIACTLTINAFSATKILTESRDHLIKKNEPFLVIFDEAVIPAEQVGNSVEEGLVVCHPKLSFKAVWATPNTLAITPKYDAGYKTTYTWSLGFPLEFKSGKAVPIEIGETHGAQRLSLKFEKTDRYLPLPVDPALVISAYGGVKLSPSMFSKSYFRSIEPNRKPSTHIVPAEITDLGQSLSVKPRTLLIPDKNYELFLQEGDNTYTYNLGTVARFTASLSYEPDSQPANDIRNLHLSFGQPLDIKNHREAMAEFFRDNVIIRADGLEASNSEDGTKKVVSNGKIDLSFEINPDYLNWNNVSNLSDILRRKLYMPILIKGKGVFKCQVTIRKATSMDGQKLADNYIVSKEIKVKSPELYLDADNNGLINTGNRMLGFQIFNLSSVKTSSKLISPEVAYATMNAYESYYQGSRTGRKSTRKANRMRFVPFDLLDPSAITVDNSFPSEGKSKLMLSLDEIYGKEPAPGMYFIEVDGNITQDVIDGYKRFGIYSDEGDHTHFRADEASLGAQMLVQLTDLGLLWKTSGKTIFVYSYSLATGKPIQKGTIEFADENGTPLKKTNLKDGISLSDLPEKTEFIRVSSGNDTHIARLKDSGAQIYLWSYDVETPDYGFRQSNTALADYEERKVFAFTDRSLYKPGEEFHLKGIARILKGNDILPIGNQKAILTLKNPKSDTVLTREINFSEYGTFDFNYKLPDEEVGNYSVEVYFPANGTAGNFEEDSISGEGNGDDDEDYSSYYKRQMERENRTFHVNVAVQEFKRNAFEVKSKLTKPEPGDSEVKIATDAHNYTGVPVAGGIIKWVLQSSPTNFYPEEYRDYEFGDHTDYDRGYWRAYYGYKSYGYYSSTNTVSLNEKLDDEGKKAGTLKLPELKNPRTQNITVRSDVTDGNEQTIGDNQSSVVHPAEVYIGIKRRSYVRSMGEKLPINLIAVGLDGKPYTSAVDVEVTAKREEFRSSRYEGSRSTTVRNDSVSELNFSTTATITPEDSKNKDKGGRTIEIPSNKPGIYTVQVKGKDPKGHEFYSATKVYVHGGDFSPWEYQDGMQIKLVPDKPLYQPGDKAKILLQTPIEGQVMVTVEREKVLRSYSRTVTIKDSVVEIPIEESDAPNVYVSVFLVKGAKESARQFQDPQLKLGYCSLRIQPSAYTLKVKLDAPKESVLPGSKTTIKGTVTDSKGKAAANTEITLYVEDEGVLDVIGYSTPDPINYFYSTRVLDVSTRTILNRILSEDANKRSYDNKGIFIGGGGDMEGEELEQMMRKDFNPCAFWVANIKTDANGRFNVEYTNPDTLTRYRVMAVAADSKNRFGSGDVKYVVNKPVMLEPAPPFFASEGDEIAIPVSVSKTTDRQGKWLLTLNANATARVDQPSLVIEIPASGSVTIPFNVKFVDIGEAKLSWSIKPSDDQGQVLTDGVNSRLVDNVEHTFNVQFPAPILREDHMFQVGEGGTNQSASVDLNNLISDELKSSVKCTMDLSLSSSPMLYAGNSMKFLLQYPHGCLEQKSSKLIPWLYADLLSKYLPSFPVYNDENRKAMIQKGVNGLLKHQLNNGALSYWNGGESMNSEFAPYAALVLLISREQGADVPEEALTRLWNNWQKTVKSDHNAPFNYYMACWVMAKAGVLSETELNKVMDEASSLSRMDACFLALAVLESKRTDADKLAREIVAKSEKRFNEEHSWRYYHLNAVELIYRTKLDPQGSDTARFFTDYLIRKREESSYYYTWQSGWDTLAMGYYLSALQENADPVNVEVQIADNVSPLELASDGKAQQKTFTLNDNAKVTVKNIGDKLATAYVRLAASGKPTNMRFEAVADRGFSISRIYEILDGDGNWHFSRDFHVGDIVRVVIEARGGTNDYEYAVIEDYLPSTFEPINPALTSQQVGGLPEGYSWNHWVSNVDFLKDRVNFFVTSWGRGSILRATYLVRVVKSGEVTAPPAKAELMYQPQVYGLTTNERISVKPREKDGDR